MLPTPQIPLDHLKSLPGSDVPRLVQAGDGVRARLDAAPSVDRVNSPLIEMYFVRRFLSPDECAALIALTDAGARPSTRLGVNYDPEFRTSHTCRLPAEDATVAAVDQRIADVLGLPASHSETSQGQRYAPGQRFKTHNDYFAAGQPYSAAVAAEGGQRTWTAMAYLNVPGSGGETSFPHVGIRIAPKAGILMIWNNLDRSGLANAYSRHEGLPVGQGTKYVLTKWFREREWRPGAMSDTLRTDT